MKKRYFFPVISMIVLLSCVVLLIALWFWDKETTDVIKIILSLILVPVIVCVVFYNIDYYKNEIQFLENMLQISDKKTKRSIYFDEIKEVRYVLRNAQMSMKKRGKSVQDAKGYRACTPYYDIINNSDELITTIDLMIWRASDVERYFLLSGIPVYTVDGIKKPRKKRMTGEMLERLSNNPIQPIDYQSLEEILDDVNREIRQKNGNRFSIWKNIIIISAFLLIMYFISEFISFLIASIMLVGVCVIYRIKTKNVPEMKKEDMYEAGWVYWGMDMEDFILYFRGDKMKRKDLQEIITMRVAKINELNYCIMNCTLDMVVMVGESLII